MSARSPGPWRLELVESFPFGIKIVAADGHEVVGQAAAAFSSRQNSRADNADGVGFPYNPHGTACSRAEAGEAIARQDANAHAMTAAPDMLQALRYCETLIACSGINGSAQTLACVRAAIAKADGK